MTHASSILAAVAAHDADQFLKQFRALRDKATVKQILERLSTASTLVLQDPYREDIPEFLNVFDGEPTASAWGEALRTDDPRVKGLLDRLWKIRSLTMDGPWPQIRVLDALAFLPSLTSFSPEFEEDRLGNLAHHAPKLVHLKMEGCGLSRLEDGLCELAQLETLNLKGNELDAIPGCIGDLQALVSLDLSHNHIYMLPDSIGHCTHLARLDLSHNPLSVLPSTLSQLSGLKSLSMGHLELAQVPTIDFAMWALLEYLALPAIGIQDLRTIEGLRSLHTLDMASNPVTQVPLALPALASLTISSDQLSDLVHWLPQLNALTTLIIEGGDQPISMDMLAGLKQLRQLAIHCAPVISLEGIASLSQLTTLSLVKTELVVIPEEIRMLKQLQVLRIEQNPLQQLPNVFGGFEHLRFVYLNHNQFQVLPDSLLLNWSIRNLYASGNPFNPYRLEDMQRKGRQF